MKLQLNQYSFNKGKYYDIIIFEIYHIINLKAIINYRLSNVVICITYELQDMK